MQMASRAEPRIVLRFWTDLRVCLARRASYTYFAHYFAYFAFAYCVCLSLALRLRLIQREYRLVSLKFNLHFI